MPGTKIKSPASESTQKILGDGNGRGEQDAPRQDRMKLARPYADKIPHGDRPPERGEPGYKNIRSCRANQSRRTSAASSWSRATGTVCGALNANVFKTRSA